MKLRLMRIYHNMKQRCNNPNNTVFSRYGGRGIRVCDLWECSYNEFAAWALLNGYRDDLTLDRIDNDGNYCPENCKWVTRKEQANNRHDNVFVEWNGQRKTITAWAESLGFSDRTLWSRIQSGWSVERAFTEPAHSDCKSRFLTYNGETKTMSEFAKERNMSLNTLSRRINTLGWPIERALNTPVKKRALT